MVPKQPLFLTHGHVSILPATSRRNVILPCSLLLEGTQQLPGSGYALGGVVAVGGPHRFLQGAGWELEDHREEVEGAQQGNGVGGVGPWGAKGIHNGCMEVATNGSAGGRVLDYSDSMCICFQL